MKDRIEFFALDIVRRSITIDNTIELINKTYKWPEENKMEIDQSEPAKSKTKITKLTNPRGCKTILHINGIYLNGHLHLDRHNNRHPSTANLYKDVWANFEREENWKYCK
ncbi:hypothetical protein E3Q13_02880 [Wallemia mellicola]|uniref:Uncharacterized protein n=1 Tax=Wallemia mellicola TaxID=1708541 RepID=A0AB38MTT2_9BASI|nr:hypothetical protein E3Q13_02880 [Wallemia mellicola]TIC64362.1 hypothetical protein E3Q02_02636 [Wallemia mellicola]